MNERAKEITKRFTDSWLQTETVFEDLVTNHGFKRFEQLQQYFLTLKNMGEDKFFRSQRSMDGLILSRSVEPGLRLDQKHIKIEPFDKNIEVTFRDGSKIYRQFTIENYEDKRLLKLLQTLKDTSVD